MLKFLALPAKDDMIKITENFDFDSVLNYQINEPWSQGTVSFNTNFNH